MGDARSRTVPAEGVRDGVPHYYGWVRATLVSGTERDVIRHSGDWHERVNQFVVPSRPFFQKLLEYGVADPFQYVDLTVEVSCSKEMWQTWGLSRLGRVLDNCPVVDYGEDPPRLVWKATLWDVLRWLEAQLLPGVGGEPRAFARAIEGIVRTHWPNVHRAWREVVADGVRLTGREVAQLRTALDNRPVPYLLHQKLFKETDDPT